MNKPAAATSAFVLHRRTIVAAVVAVGALLSLGGWSFVTRSEERRIDAEFQHRQAVQMRLARERLRLHIEIVRDLRAYLENAQHVDAPEFTAYTRPLLGRLPAARVFQWAARVPAAHRGQYEAAQAALHPGFRLWERDVAGKIGAAAIAARPRDEYWPITWVEPLAGNETSLGFDLHESIVTRPMLDDARRTREMRASPQVRLIRSTQGDRGSGVIFIEPVFRPGASGTEPDGFAGYIQAIFSVDRLLEQVHSEQPDEALDLAYYDDSAQFDHLRLLYARIDGRAYSGSRDNAASALEAPAFPRPDVMLVAETFHVGGRDWRLVVAPNTAWLARQHTAVPWLVLAGELALTALAGLFAHGLLSRTARIEQQVAWRTAELAESRRQLASLLADMPGAAYRSEAAPPFRTVFISDGVLKLTGYRATEFFADRQWADLMHPDDLGHCRRRLAEALERREPFEVEYRIRHADGTLRHIWDRGHPVLGEDGTPAFIEGLMVDATTYHEAEQRNREFERQLLETQKLESLGVLAGGIAHDFNNILTAVLGNASLLRGMFASDHAAQPQVRSIENAARRAADLCTQMLAYAGKGRFVTTEIDASALVRDTAALLQVSVPKHTRLQLELSEHLPPVLADATQLRQIMMNLVLNAVDAVAGRPDGSIRIATRAVELSANFFQGAVQKPALPAGPYVILEIADNGSGMTPETQARIFEPFFTTKFSGRGLGLAAVLGIIRGHRGALFVDSRSGAGTTFRVVLPVHQAKAGGGATPALVPPAANADDPGRLQGTVLLIDDEPAVRQVAAAVLTRHGAKVIEAADGAEALSQCRQHAGAIDLILLDLTMPGLSGEETLRRLRLLDHRQKVVVMSGYSETETMRRCSSLGATGFLAKPFEIDALLARVRQHLP
ncbi:MAG: CHASE domain-containing protein [Opitutae bacterium]|nr:CHASE domain-containing protein [Opitutae bacterium]